MTPIKRRKGYRWIVVDHCRWQWRARDRFDARCDDGRRVVVADLRPLVGGWRRGHQKKHGEGIVMPSLAATLIRSGSAATVGDYRR